MIKLKSGEPILQDAARLIKDGNVALNAAKKTVENAKKVVADWLKRERNIDVDTLPIGEIICIGDSVMITIGSQNRFDEASFQVEHPKLYEEYKKENPCKQYKPLV